MLTESSLTRKSSVGGGRSTLTCSAMDHKLLQKEEHYYWVLMPQVSEKIQHFVANLSSDLRVTCKEMSK